MALTIGIDFEANIARIEENTRKAADHVQGMADRIDTAVSFAKGALQGLAGALSIGAFAAAVRHSIDLADSLNDLSKKTGASVETLSGLRLAAEQSGTSLEGIANGSKKLATTMVEHQAVFAKLGINTKNQTEAMIQLGDVFAGMDDPVQRSALAVKIFGKSGDEMLPMLMEGSEGIRRMVERGQELSGITTQMARDADHFNDSLAEMRLRSQNLYVGIGAQLLPVLNETIDAFNEWNKSGSSTSVIGEALATSLETIVVIGANVAYVFQSIGREIGGIVAQFSAMGEAGGIFTKEGRAAWSAVGEELKADAEAARKSIDAFSERISNARVKKPEADGEGGRTDKRGEKLLKDLSGAGDEFAKLRQKDIDGWVKYADAVLAESERIEAIERDRIIKENDRAAASELAWTQGVAARLARIQESNFSEEELERGKFTQIQIDLQFALDQRFITEQQYHELLEQEQLKHEARLGNVMAQGALDRQKLSQKSWDVQVSTYAGMFKNMTATAATSSREMFEINKAAAITETTINTYRAAQGAYAAMASIPYIGPALGIAAAAVAVAAGLANVQAISSAQYGSSTSAPSIAGGNAIPVYDAGSTASPLLPTPQAAEAKKQVNVTLVGSQFSYDQVVNEILPLINEASDNGADIRVMTA